MSEQSLFGRMVRAVRARYYKFVGFQDAETGLFISPEEARSSLKFDPERNRVVDSFGNVVGVGNLELQESGARFSLKNVDVLYMPLEESVRSFKPGGNQEIIERFTIVNKDGSLSTFEISHGLGNKYKRGHGGGRWRYETSKALDYKQGERPPTKELQRAVLHREFIVKTIF